MCMYQVALAVLRAAILLAHEPSPGSIVVALFLATAHPRTVRTSLALLDSFFIRRLVSPFGRLLEILLVHRILFGFAVSRTFLLCTASLIALLINHAGTSARLWPGDGRRYCVVLQSSTGTQRGPAAMNGPGQGWQGRRCRRADPTCLLTPIGAAFTSP